MRKLHLISTACTAVLLAAAAMADDEKALTDLSSWDADSDKKITQQEWSDAIEEHALFDKVDTNNNGIFDADEALAPALRYETAMDLDAGGHIERQEFVVGLFGNYDENDDDMLDATEFEEFSSTADISPMFTTGR